MGGHPVGKFRFFGVLGAIAAQKITICKAYATWRISEK